MNQLFTERYVVIWMLTISRGIPTGLQEGISRQRAVSGRRLEISKKTKVTFGGISRVRKVLTRQRRIDIAINRPTNIVVRE